MKHPPLAETFQTPYNSFTLKIFSKEQLQKTIQKNTSVDERDDVGETTLMIACYSGFVEIVNELIDESANVNATDSKGMVPLMYAVRNRQIANTLLEHGADVNVADNDGVTPLLYALSLSLRQGKTEIANTLLEHGAHVNVADNDGVTPLLVAYNSPAMFTALIDRGADVHTSDNNGTTPLMLTDDEDVCRKLLELGVDVNAIDNQNRTALFGVRYNADILSLLVKAGANVHTTDIFGRTALINMIELRVEIDDTGFEPFERLLELGADIHVVDNYGRNAVMVAAFYGFLDMALILVKRGADITFRDQTGKSIIAHAADGIGKLSIGRSRGESIVAEMIKQHYGDEIGHDGLLMEMSQMGQFDIIRKTLKLFGNPRDFSITVKTVREINFFRVGLQPPLDWENINARGVITRHIEIDDFHHSFIAEPETIDQMLRGFSINLTSSLKQFVKEYTDLSEKNPYNISLNSFEDNRISLGLVFRYGSDTVVSIYNDADGAPQVSHLKATAPICAGEGRVIYTKVTSDGSSRVYENSIDLKGEEKELCHLLSSEYEKNWGCFGREGPGPLDKYFIVYSVFPLRIFEVRNGAECTEVQSVLRDYPNFDRIEQLWVDKRDSRDTSIFRGGSRGIQFGGEYLFVGHVTLSDSRCFPHWFVEKNTSDRGYSRMYFMFFYTVQKVNGSFSVSRISSCFQPPSGDNFYKIIFPVGIARRGTSDEVVVSFGRDDKECLITAYSNDDIDTLLLPVGEWTYKNYVFHPNYATSILRGFKTRHTKPRESVRKSAWNSLGMIEARSKSSKRMGLTGTSPESNGLFNPSISGSSNERFVTAWRRFNGNVRNWDGKNSVSIEACTLVIDGGSLRYKRESQPFEIQIGTSETFAEDPRVFTGNGCPILMVNDRDKNNNRRMYVHNLDTDEGAMTLHKFCHDMSESFEKNWGPFYAKGQLFFVYSVNPLVVGRVDGPACPSGPPMNIQCSKVGSTSTRWDLKHAFRANGLEMRGGTPGIQVGANEYLFVGHAVQEKSECFPDYLTQRSIAHGRDRWHTGYGKLYTVFFYTIAEIDHTWKMKRLSCCSHLPGKREHFTKIVFPCGLAKAKLAWSEEDSYVVSFGEKDVYGSFCAMTREFVEYILRPVESWDEYNYVVDINYFENIAALSPVFRLHNFERYQ